MIQRQYLGNIDEEKARQMSRYHHAVDFSGLLLHINLRSSFS